MTNLDYYNRKRPVYMSPQRFLVTALLFIGLMVFVNFVLPLLMGIKR